MIIRMQNYHFSRQQRNKSVTPVLLFVTFIW